MALPMRHARTVRQQLPPPLTRDASDGVGGAGGQIGDLNKALEPYNSLWNMAVNFHRAYPTWMEGPFMQLSPEEVEADVAAAAAA